MIKSSSSSLFFEKSRKKHTELQMIEMTENDKEITIFVETKKLKVKEGQSIFDIPFELTDNVMPLIIYAIGKNDKTRDDIIFISYYLSSMPSLIRLFNPKKSFINQSDLLYQLSYAFRLEKQEKNKIICRINDPGDSFYLILTGSVSIILSKEIIVKMTRDNYIKHLKYLINLKEYLIAKEIIYLNESIYECYDLLDLIDSYKATDKLNNRSSSSTSAPYNNRKEEYLSVDNYINRTIPIIEPLPTDANYDESKTSNVTIKIYSFICNCNDGQTFGDIALSDKNNQRRTATVICNSKCCFATLNQTAYDITVKDYQNKLRKNNIGAVLSNPIFEGIRIDRFIKKYFNHFKEVSLTQGTILFKQGDQLKDIYFLKEGEVEITSRLSMVELSKVIKEKQADCKGIVNKREQKTYDDIMHEETNDNVLFTKAFLNRILFIKERDVVGMDEFMYKKKYFCTAVCFSKQCSFFTINYEMFMAMKNDDVILNNNVPLYMKNRNGMICDRLIKVRNQEMKNRRNKHISIQYQSEQLLELFKSQMKINDNKVKSNLVVQYKSLNCNSIMKRMSMQVKKRKENDKEKDMISQLQLLKNDDRILMKNKVITTVYHKHAMSLFNFPMKIKKNNDGENIDDNWLSSYGFTSHKTNKNNKNVKNNEPNKDKISQSTTTRINDNNNNHYHNNGDGTSSSRNRDTTNLSSIFKHSKDNINNQRHRILSISTSSLLKRKHPHITKSVLLLNQYHNLSQFNSKSINNHNHSERSFSSGILPTNSTIIVKHKPTNTIIDFLAMDRLIEEMEPHKKLKHYHPKATLIPFNILCSQRVKLLKHYNIKHKTKCTINK